MMKLRKAITIVFLLVLTASAFAQHSLYDNANYKKSIDLRRMADVAFQQGDYIKAKEYSVESERLSVLATKEAEIQLQMWTANSWKNRAKARIDFGEANNAAGQNAAVWKDAKASYALAQTEYTAKRYVESTTASKLVVDLMKDFTEAKYPADYTVRLIPEDRDCFWRIAEYPFIYGDPWKWRILYEANKDRIPDPNNPDWIEPGIVLTIPSIKGEIRAGAWTPVP